MNSFVHHFLATQTTFGVALKAFPHLAMGCNILILSLCWVMGFSDNVMKPTYPRGICMYIDRQTHTRARAHTYSFVHNLRALQWALTMKPKNK